MHASSWLATCGFLLVGVACQDVGGASPSTDTDGGLGASTGDGGSVAADAASPDGAPKPISIEIEKTVRLDKASIWSGLSADESYIHLTTMFDRHLRLKYLDRELGEVKPAVPLTLDSDLAVGHIDDHAHVLVGNTLYVVFSSSQNKNGLFLFRATKDGTRIGGLVTEVERSDLPTNDPHLFTDGTSIYVMYGGAGQSRMLATYDLNLSRTSLVPLTMSERRGQLGSTQALGDGFLMFTGDETQQNLMVSRWDKNWKEATPFGTTLIAGDPSTWNYFASGSQYDPATGRWYLGYHVFRTAVRDSDTVTLAAFDGQFRLLGTKTIGEQGTFRPHVLVRNGELFIAYDSIGAVYLSRVSIGQGKP